MKAWILRYAKPREGIRDLRQLDVVERDEEGSERVLETIEVESGTSAFGDTVVEQVRQGRVRIVFDLVHEKNLDSSDLAQIMGASTRAGEAGGKLVLANPNTRVQEILRITRLEEVLTPHASIEEAVASFSA